MTDSFDPDATSTSQPPGRAKRQWLFALLVSLATALAIISPFFFKGYASGHDFSFHAASWLEAATQWRQGILFPRWADGANHGFGEPRFIFYPPISWIFGAALSLLFPWIYVPGAFIALVQTLAGLSAFAFGRRLFKQPGALLCAVFYAANPYALLIIYMRSDFAELFAMIFFPLLFLLALQLFGALETPERSRLRSVAGLAITFAAIWLTNAPAAVVASYSLGVLLIFFSLARKSLRLALHGAAALLLGLGLASFYLIPAIHEQNWVSITQALASGLAPAENFLYTTIADQEHNAFNRIASNTAVLMVLLTTLAAAFAYLKSRKPLEPALPPPLRNALLLLFGLATVLMLRVTLPLWLFLPKLRFVQFPWRWMSILAIPFACFLAASATAIPRRFRWYATAALRALLLAVLVGASVYMIHRTWWDSEDVPALLEAQKNDQGYEGVDEYDPACDDHSSLPEKSPRATVLRPNGDPAPRSAKVQIDSWTAERKDLQVNAREPLRLSLRLLNYPAWQALIDNRPAAPLQPSGETNLMVLPFAAGSSHVVVRFTRTPDRTAGAALTILSILILLVILRKPPRP